MRASAVLLFAVLFACSTKGAEQVAKAPPPPPVKVDLTPVVLGDAPEVLVLTGLLKADQRAEVTSDTQGKVIAVMIERGQRVRMGDPVVRLDVRTAALSAREAQANLSAARAQKNLAEEECKRAQALLDKGAITKSEYDRQTTQCTSALEQVSAAQARTEMIAKAVADGLVRAPFDGVVADRMVNAGEWVAPGRPLFTLVDDQPLKIELSVPEKAVQAIKLGQQVTLTAVAIDCVAYRATVSRIGAEIGRTRSMIVEATLDQAFRGAVDSAACAKVDPAAAPFALVPGMFAEAEVVVGQTQRPIVPTTALFQKGKQWHVYTAAGGELQDKIVQRGPSPGPGQVSILQGLTGTEQVLASVVVAAAELQQQQRELADGLAVIGGAPSAAPAAPGRAPAATPSAPAAPGRAPAATPSAPAAPGRAPAATPSAAGSASK